jgi:hypothetical protein
MSDLTATNCGCSSSCGNNGFGSLIWIFLLSSMCGGNGNSCGGGGSLFGGLNFGGGSGDSCDMLMTLLLLSCICGGGNSGSGCGC